MLSHTISQIFFDIDNELHLRYQYGDYVQRTMYEKLIAIGGSIHPYRNNTDFDMKFDKYEVTINPFTFKVSEIINRRDEQELLTPFGLSKVFTGSAMREKWIFEINNTKTIHYYASPYFKYTTHPYVLTEEEYFQESTVHDFGTMTLEDMQQIEEFRLAVLQCVENYKRGKLWNN